MPDPIVKSINVPCSADVAFDVFVNRIAAWWPLESHAASVSAGKAALAVMIEPRVGGSVYETMWDGSRDAWGEVLEFEAGRKLAMTWHPGNNKESPTRVDVAFDAVSSRETRVTLTHSAWESWGARAEDMRSNYDGGWEAVFNTQFAGACQTA